MPGPKLLAGALAASAITLQLGLFFGAMGVAYRFQFPGVAAALITVPVAVAVVRGRRDVDVAAKAPERDAEPVSA